MSFIQNLFTSRDNNANAATYVGQQDRIWWNPDANAFYYSDGNTAGGIPIGSSSGNGMPHGPANSVQLNAGNGTFLGSSSLTFSGNILTIVGNATANYFIGDGSQLTNLPVQPGTYSNANVAAYLPVYSGNIGGNNIGISGAINAVGEITTFANIVASPGGFFIGNGSQLTGLPLANYTGNISGGNISITNTANLGNLTISDQTISGTITNRDIVIDTAGNGIVDINGAFNVHSGNLTANPIFEIDIDGRVKTLVPNSSNIEGAFNIVGSTDGAEVFPQNFGVMLHTTGQATIPARIYNDGVANYAAVINRRYNGISSAPTGVLQNQIIGRLGATPYLVDDTWPSISTTRLDMVALEDQTTTAQGSAIKLYTVALGATSPILTADFIAGQLTMSGNLNPALNSTYTLGNAANQWQSVYLGNSGVYIKDITTGFNTQLSVDSGVLSLANITRVQVGNIQLTNTGLLSTVSTQDIVIGTVGDSGNTVINNAGIKFTDGSVQNTAAIPLIQRGNANGVATLGSDGLVPASQLPAGAVVYKGTWDAGNNTPTLTNGVGTAGWEYSVSVAGTVDFGAGPITFSVGDFVIYSGSVWQQIASGGSGVTSFNTRTGTVTLTSGDVTNALSAGSIINSKLANAGINITYSGGLSGNASVNLGGTLALTNSGVTGITAGTGVTISGATGNVTVSIGQAVGTANSVSFQSVSSTTTVAATSNITGGNLNTGGRIVATGNIVTSGFLFGNGSQLTGLNAFQTINANGTNLTASSTAGLVNMLAGNNIVITSNVANANIVTAVSDTPTFTGNVTGGNILTGGLISATGNIRGANVSVVGNTTTANLTVSGTSNLNSNANVKISGGSAGQQLTTDGAGNLYWQLAQAGNNIIQTGANTTVNVDFTTNSLHLLYLPTGPVTISLSNYTAGAQGRVIVRFGTPYTIALGVANTQQTTEGLTTIPISGGGGHKINGNQSVQLLYTCFDNTAGNCYVASTFL